MGKTKTKVKTRSVGDSPKPPITIRSTNPKVIDDNIAKLEKAIKGVDEASEISYDNTGSGLAAENVQSAIDEIVEGLTAPAASNVTYDNTSSGLTADDVQEAIDELNSTKLKFGQSTAFTKSTETVSGSYPTNTIFICTIYQSGGNGAVSTNILYSTNLNKRIYVDGTHFAYFNTSGAFSMEGLENGDTVSILPLITS